MDKKALTIEIARYPIKINVKDPLIFSFLERSLSEFLSTGIPVFTIDIINKLVSSLKILAAEMPSGVAIFKQNRRIFFHTKSNPPITLGFVDLKKKKGTFIHQQEELSQQYLMPFLRSAFQLFLFIESGFLIHACGIANDGQGYLFAGPSGCGKTTIAKLSPNHKILSDEFICLRKSNKDYLIYPTPWQGRGQEGNVLEKIFFLRKGDTLRFEKLIPALAIKEILSNVIYPFYNQEIFKRILSSLTQMVQQIPCYVMQFSLTSPFWEKITYDSR